MVFIGMEPVIPHFLCEGALDQRINLRYVFS